jgi:hypothetical protein
MVSYVNGTAEVMDTIKQRTADDMCANKRRLKNQ